MRNWGRRGILAGGAVLAGATLIRPREARAAKAMTVVLESEVTILDPHFITATITRTFGLHVFDVLFAMYRWPALLRLRGLHEAGQPPPQDRPSSSADAGH